MIYLVQQKDVTVIPLPHQRCSFGLLPAPKFTRKKWLIRDRVIYQATVFKISSWLSVRTSNNKRPENNKLRTWRSNWKVKMLFGLPQRSWYSKSSKIRNRNWKRPRRNRLREASRLRKPRSQYNNWRRSKLSYGGEKNWGRRGCWMSRSGNRKQSFKCKILMITNHILQVMTTMKLMSSGLITARVAWRTMPQMWSPLLQAKEARNLHFHSRKIRLPKMLKRKPHPRQRKKHNNRRQMEMKVPQMATRHQTQPELSPRKLAFQRSLSSKKNNDRCYCESKKNKNWK